MECPWTWHRGPLRALGKEHMPHALLPSPRSCSRQKNSPREGKFQSTPCVYLGRRMSVQSKLVGQDSKDQPPSSVSAMPARGPRAKPFMSLDLGFLTYTIGSVFFHTFQTHSARSFMKITLCRSRVYKTDTSRDTG